MDDMHAKVVIEGLLGELMKSTCKEAALREIITINVGHNWDTQIDALASTYRVANQQKQDQVLQKLLYGAPGSNPSGDWENEIRRLVQSVDEDKQ